MKEPITIEKNSDLLQVIRGILHKNISRFLITDGQEITSIITEKDVGNFLLKDDTERKLDEIPITDVAKPIISVSSDTSIQNCARTMLENAIGSLAVSEGDKVLGIITKTDLAEYFAQNYAGKKIVGEYMSPYYAWMYSDVPLYLIVQKMIQDKISRLILRGRDEAPVGIVSIRDLFRIALTQGEETDVVDNRDPVVSVVFSRRGFLSESGFGGSTIASEIMQNEIITVNYDDDLAKACQVLIDNHINGVGVLSQNGVLIGILSKTDVIKALSFLD